MAAPLRARAKKKRSKKADGASDLDGSAAAPSSQSLGDLVRSFSAQLDFAPTTAPEKDTAAAKAKLAPELPELRASIRQLSQRLGGLRSSAEALAQRLSEDDDGTSVGSAAYVDMKVQMLLSYVVGLTYYLLLKARGAPVRDHAVSLRLMWLRTLLEKLRPVDQRLQYQMNKLLQAVEAKSASAGDDAAADPRSLRPGQLSTTVEDEGSGEEAEEADARADQDPDGIYRPPRIAQVEYTQDHVTAKERAERDLERQKRRFENSDLVRSLREEFTDAPAEIRGEERSAKVEKAQRKMAEQEIYEEENMVRLRASKTEKREKQRLFKAQRSHSGGTVSLGDAADFNALASALEGGGKGGKGKGRGRRGSGSALQGFQGATERLREARNVVDSVVGGRMPEGLGAFKRGRGGGGGGGKRQRR